MNKMWIKYSIIISLAIAPRAGSYAQYYYKDIIVTGQIGDNYRSLKANKVTTVTLRPSENGIPARADIQMDQTVYALQNLVVTHTAVPEAPESWLKSYYNDNGWLIATTDSSEQAVTRSIYQYNAAGQIVTISSRTNPKNDPAETEVHQWAYNSNGKPVRMLKIKDNTDTTVVSFDPDEKGNVGEERAVRRKGNVGTYYYYYDSKNRLTDVAQNNRKANRILPSYMFEYNDEGRVTQMIIVPEASSDYQTWKYYYTPEGLKRQDICFNKQKQPLGKVDYQYEFSK
jgi:hypothetical protein